MTVRLYASDEIQYFAYLRSAWFDHDLSFDNEYRYFYDRNIARAHRFKEAFLDETSATGLRRNFAPMGSALLWSPLYAIAMLVLVERMFGSAPPPRFSRSTSMPSVRTALYGFRQFHVRDAARACGGGATSLDAVWARYAMLF